MEEVQIQKKNGALSHSSCPEKHDAHLEFFTVFLPDFSCRLQVIAPAFEIQGTFPRKCTITNFTAGREWTVTLEKEEEQKGKKLFYFKEGWPIYVKECGLSLGDIQVFFYHSPSNFCVKILGTSCCERQKFLSDRSNTEVNQKEKMYQKQKLGDSEFHHKGLKRGRDEAEDQKEAYPSFSLTLTYSRCGYLNPVIIPFAFIREYVKIKESRVVRLRVAGSKKIWPVKLSVFLKNRSATFGVGWTKFVKDNKLGENDFCVFELRKRGKVVLFRVSFSNSEGVSRVPYNY